MPKAQCDDNCLHNRTCHHTQDIVLFRQTRLTYHWQQYQSTATWSFRANGYGWWFHHPKRLWLWRLTYGAWIFHILRQGALHLFIKISVLTASLLVHPNYKDFANFSNATNKQTRNYPQIQPSQKLVGSVNLSYTLLHWYTDSNSTLYITGLGLWPLKFWEASAAWRKPSTFFVLKYRW